jgi:predicted aspartyl protease
MKRASAMRMMTTTGALAALALTACAPTPEPAPRAEPEPAASATSDARPMDLDGYLAGEGYRALPLRRLATGHFAVDGTSEAVVLTLIVDTGASHTILDQRRAGRFGVTARPAQGRAAGLGTADQAVGAGVLRNVALGTLRFDSLAVSVLDLSHVNRVLAEMDVEPIDGIIGADMLLRKRAIIDYGGPMLYVRDLGPDE